MVSIDKCSRSGLVVLTIVADILMSVDTVRIEKLLVPEVVQSGATSGAVLDCQYTGAEESATVQWLFNQSRVVYEWSPGTQPRVFGPMEGRVDLSYKESSRPFDERRAMFIADVTPELSGEYTCRVVANSSQAQQTKTMLVYSPEREFDLELHRRQRDVEIRCCARGLHPQPELTIERDGQPLAAQQQRVWRGAGALYDAEARARARAWPDTVTCRLQLPAAGYTVIRKFVHVDPKQCNLSRAVTSSSVCILLAILTAVYQHNKGLDIIYL